MKLLQLSDILKNIKEKGGGGGLLQMYMNK